MANDGSDRMLKDIHVSLTSRCAAMNAAQLLNVRAQSGVDLSYPAMWLCNALAVENSKEALYAFDVLDMLCGGKGSLPRSPAIHTPFPSPPANVSADGTPLGYKEKVSLAADLICSFANIERGVDEALQRLRDPLLCRTVCLLYMPEKVNVC